MLQILELTRVHPLWEELANYAEACSWRAGPQLAEAMRADGFPGWERVFAARADDSFAGYCTLSAHDELPEDCGFSPFIGFVFVGYFFFCSGYGLYQSCQKRRDYLDGFPRRLALPLLIIYYACNTIFLVGRLAMRETFGAQRLACLLCGSSSPIPTPGSP